MNAQSKIQKILSEVFNNVVVEPKINGAYKITHDSTLPLSKKSTYTVKSITEAQALVNEEKDQRRRHQADLDRRNTSDELYGIPFGLRRALNA